MCNEEEDSLPINREQLTALRVAVIASNVACEFWVWLNSGGKNKPNKPLINSEQYFWDEIFTSAFDNNETDGDISVKKIGILIDGSVSESNQAPFALLQVMNVIVDYSVQAFKAVDIGKNKLAWTYASDASYWSGILRASQSFKAEPSPLAINALNAALARLAGDPKQKALKEIDILYSEQKSQFKRRGYTAKFVRDMHDKYPVIEDQKTIARRVAKLNKKNESIPR